MQRFTLPRDMYHGKGALETLETLGGKKTIVRVGGGSMRHGGFLSHAVTYLGEAGMEVRLFESIESDSSMETVMHGTNGMLVFEPDWIVAMGEGSPIDAAKTTWIKYEYPEITFEGVCKVFGVPRLRRKAQFCVISSISGTAIEVTAFSIITDYQKGIKCPVADFEITPDVAIVGPDLVTTMLIKLIAHTGMDAMTHAVEIYVSTANSNFTNPLAIRTIEMVKEHLVKSYNEDMGSRAVMHDAQCLAGQTFSNALLGTVRSMAHKTGTVFADQGAHIIHGAANAMYLPRVVKSNAKSETARRRYGVIVDCMHLGGSSGEEKVNLSTIYLHEMNDALHIPHCIAHYGRDGLPAEEGFVNEDAFLARVEGVATNTILDACMGDSPWQPSREEVVKLLKCCYYGTGVDPQYRN